jgi:multicomponent Na+:H+ antiporter subunit D
MLGGLLHIAMHAFGKITLFFCAGAIFVATGKKKISEMAGLGRRMPLTMLAFLFGSLSVIGLPPTGGFLSKWALLLGTVETGRYGLLAVLLGSSFLNAAYFLPIVYRAFFVPASEPVADVRIREAPLWCLVPLCLTALATCVLFFYPDLFMALAQLAGGRL